MFNEQLNGRLMMFDVLHLVTLMTLVMIFIIIKKYKNLLYSQKNEKLFRLSLGLLLFIFEVSFHVWIFMKGEYTYQIIPFTGFCALTNVLTIYALLFNKTKWFDYLIYYALTGALFALIFVDTSYAIPHFRYFHYFIVHYGFLLASLFYLINDKIDITFKKYVKASLILFIYTLVILILNLILDTNWFYLFESPVKEISDLFGLPLYTILWMLAIIVLTYGWYTLLNFLKNKKYIVKS